MNKEPAIKKPLRAAARKQAFLVLALLAVASALAGFGASVTEMGQDSILSYDFERDVQTASLRETFARGKDLHEQECSGCHSLGKRLIGPSYIEIAGYYKKLGDKIGTRSGSANQALIAAAISHLSNKWRNYPRGPVLKLAHNDRIALACWILKSTAPDNSQRYLAGDSSPPVSSLGWSKQDIGKNGSQQVLKKNNSQLILVKDRSNQARREEQK